MSDDFITVMGKDQPDKVVSWQHIRPTGLEQADVTVSPAGYFTFSAKLDPGINRFSVAGTYLEVYYAKENEPIPTGYFHRYTHSHDISQCTDCHEAGSSKLAEGGQPQICLGCHVVVSQNPENDQDPMQNGHFTSVVASCRQCHEPHISKNPKLLKQERLEPCKMCHTKQYDGAKGHPAYEEGSCAACHDTHFSGFPKNLYRDIKSTCNECHSQGKAITEKKFHPPSAIEGKKYCSTCHDPHGTTPKLTRSDKATLCNECHPKVLREGHGKELKTCTLCHDPHREMGSRLLKQDFPAGCDSCHDGYRDSATVHQPVKAGCQSCHSPHRNDNLAKAKEKCLLCHNFKKDAEVAALHGNLPMTVDQCLKCHPVHDSNQKRLVKGKTHFPLTQGKCDACHGQGAAAAIKIKDVASKCASCHSTLRDLQSSRHKIHPPLEDEGCAACHDPHMSDIKSYLKKPVEKLCRECHGEVPKEEGGKKAHPAVKDCSDCHTPHGNDNKKFLVKAKDLCLSCHDDPTGSMPVKHAALDEGCGACHDPHAGFGKGFLRAEMKGLCKQCHGDKAAQGKVVHQALDEGCNACHKPHASKNKKLLNSPVDALCKDCHSIPGKEGAIPHTGLAEGCSSCHKPHSSPNKKLLTKDAGALCLDCHSDPKTAGKVHTAIDEGCGACHKPHGSDQKNLLTASGDKLCLGCHKDPAAGKKMRHDGLDDGCSGCHKPHASKEEPLLKKPVNELCKACHATHKKHVLEAKHAKA
ncbi:hypothetical protein FDZ71_03010, partial [bacterium]